MLWKRKELIRHSTLISCDLQVRAPTMQDRLNSNSNGFCFTALPKTANPCRCLLMKTSETLLNLFFGRSKAMLIIAPNSNP